MQLADIRCKQKRIARADVQALIVGGPKQAIDEKGQKEIDKFLMEGKGVIFLVDAKTEDEARALIETLPLAKTDESRGRLLAVIQHDVKRLNRLIICRTASSGNGSSISAIWSNAP